MHTGTTPKLDTRLPKVGTTIFTVMSALATEHGAINLGQGFPDFDCDPRLVDAVTQAMRNGLNQYPPMTGLPTLRTAIADAPPGQALTIVVSRAGARVAYFDPAPRDAATLKAIDAQSMSLDDLLKNCDVVTLHVPLVNATRNLVNAPRLQLLHKGAVLLNFSRDGIVDNAAVLAALGGKKLRAYVCDFPAQALLRQAGVIAMPHLGASTNEAQENVALQVAEQMADYLVRGAISNAINFPSITAEEAPKLKPFIALAERLGSFAGQLTESGIKEVRITYEGAVAGLKIKALTAAAIAGVLRPQLQDVNVVSAPVVAKERGIAIEEITRSDDDSDYESLITLTIVTADMERSISGTVFHDGKARIVAIKNIKVDAEFAPSMIYVTNEDKPGFIGRFAGLLGDAGVNIATFALGRDNKGGSAIALVEVDGEVPHTVLEQIQSLPGVRQARALKF